MKNFLRFFVQHHFLILFLLLETFSLLLLFSTNPYHKVRFYNYSHALSGRWSSKVENILDYFSLRNENQKLAEENASLYNRMGSSFTVAFADSAYMGDSLMPRKFLYLTSKVVNNTVNKQFNYMTLDKGSRGGVEPEMAVIGSEGVVGIVKSVSENYSSVLSLLNRDFRVSAKIESNGYFGPLSWSGENPDFATLIDIPFHVHMSKGDTIVTSGFGGIFPEGYMIGTIADFKLKGGNYYEISVKLSTDFRKLHYVQVIKNFAKTEIDSLENVVSQ